MCTTCIIVYTCVERGQSLKIKSTSHAVLASHALEGACLGSLNAFLMPSWSVSCVMHNLAWVCTQLECVYMQGLGIPN